ncbi:glutathione S-transferase family protein [Nostocaceae cyanobacterium CENA357]|uniref:Glutathione S-transferase family protein n=1 Tax=Atlanticothrix silvestris CENA357 TaxID=1725252 RepID=A0A8J7HEX3_9CYAN|nr:glutathione S-transferase family protein [Atlanticothrix silvestris]MBH8553771.1 glutathione S-transferase family protein [Atlanticothrix silvestris CENA357]
MTLELFCASGSLCSQKVKLVLAEKNLEWKSRLINLLAFENLQPSYMRLNPRGVVPTLIHNGQVITDSVMIIRYLDEQFPHPRLIPTEPMLREKMDGWIYLQNQFPMRELMYGNYQGIEGIVLRRSVQIKEKLIPKLMQANPDLKEQYTSKLKDIKHWNCTIQNANEIANLNTRIVPMLEILETQLSKTNWLCGASYSLVDTIWTAVLNRLNELKFGYLWENNTRPALSLYFNQLRARPSFITAIQDDKMPLPMLLAGLGRVFLGI